MVEHGLKAAPATQSVLADPARELLFRASRGVPRVASSLLRRALSLGELSTVAGLPARTLQESFMRHRGGSPMQLGRRLRLEGARRDFLAAGPGTSVRDIASRVGFMQLSRFAASYARLFGELPSATPPRPPAPGRLEDAHLQ